VNFTVNMIISEDINVIGAFAIAERVKEGFIPKLQ